MYASGGVPHMSIEQLQRQAAWVREQGFQGFKMRANLFVYQPEVEAERVAAVREALGPDRLLAMDAVQNFNLHPWSLKQIVRMLRPGGAVMGFFCTAGSPRAPFTKYEVVDDNSLRHRPHAGAGGAKHSLPNRDIIKMFDGLIVSDSFLLKNNTREFLLRRPR